MRVLHVDTGTGWRGGQQQVLWLVEGCRDLGIEQMLLAPAGSPLAERASQLGVAVTPLSKQSLSVQNLRAVRSRVSGFDLVHAHDSHAHSLVWAAATFGRRSVPPLIVSRRVGYPIGTFGRAKYRFPALFIAVSQYVCWRLIEAGVPSQKIRVIHDGVRAPVILPDVSVREEFRRRHGVEEDDFVLGTLSSFAPEKLLAEELALLNFLPATTHFWLGVPRGEPDTRSAGQALLEAAQRMELGERFRILPVGENPGPFLASLDLFFYLSEMEGLGSAILLAMAHGLPVVASKVGGIPEIIEHGQTGVLVEGEHQRELPAAIELLMVSQHMRRRMAAATREFVLSHATSDKMITQTVGLYQQLLQGSSEPRP